LTTIDNLCNELDVLKVRYDRRNLLRYMFVFADEFVNYNNLPHYQLIYNELIEWKLSLLVQHTRELYEKNTSMAYQELKIPTNAIISKTMLEYETKNWKRYMREREVRKNFETAEH
jgi:hypothetical protein